MYLSWTCHVCLRTKITFINKLRVNNLTLALEDKQQQLGCVEKQARDEMNFAGIPEGETGQLHKNAQTAASEVDTSLRCSRNRALMRESYLPCSVCNASFGCPTRKTVEFLWWQAFSISLQSLYLRQYELIRWQCNSFTLQTSVLTECTR